MLHPDQVLVLAIFFGFTPPLSLNSEIWGCARLLGEPLGLQGKEVVFFEMEWPGFELEPRASEEDALSTPPRPTFALYGSSLNHNLMG